MGERLQYRTLDTSTAGPATGWVSLKANGKELLRRVSENKPPPSPGAAIPPDFDADVLRRYCAGGLDALAAEYLQVLRQISLGQQELEEAQHGARSDGLPTAFAAYTPQAAPRDASRQRVLFQGDSITMAQPSVQSSSFVLAVARRCPELAVENGGWGGLLSMQLLEPKTYCVPPLQLPAPSDYRCDYACILIGTNDAMCISGGELYTKMAFTSRSGGGPAGLPDDFAKRCMPSLELYKKSVLATVRALKAANPGVKVALMTPPMLGEMVSESVGRGVQKSPFLVISDMAEALRSIAKSEACTVLPLFECMLHCMREEEKRGRKLREWTPRLFTTQMNAFYKALGEQTTPTLLDDVLGEAGPHLLPDLVHFGERAAAIAAVLAHSWLEAAGAIQSRDAAHT